MFGIGFMAAAWGAYFASQGMPASTSAPMSLISDSVPTAPRAAKDFEFRDVEEIRQGDKTYFIGMVKNKNKSAASGINIEVNLFKGGKFVDQYSSYLSGVIAPDEERYFKVSCGCKDNPTADHDSYKIGVLSGY